MVFWFVDCLPVVLVDLLVGNVGLIVVFCYRLCLVGVAL